eukprot:sb/3474554/
MLHVVEFHRAEGALKCSRCGEVFKFHLDLARHMDDCFELSDDDSDQNGDEQEEEEERGNEEEERGEKKKREDNCEKRQTRSMIRKESEGDGRKRKRDSDTRYDQLKDTLRDTRNTLDRINKYIENNELDFETPQFE